MYFQIPNKDDLRGSDHYPPHGPQSGSGPYVASEQCGDAASPEPEMDIEWDEILELEPWTDDEDYFEENSDKDKDYDDLPGSETTTDDSDNDDERILPIKEVLLDERTLVERLK